MKNSGLSFLLFTTCIFSLSSVPILSIENLGTQRSLPEEVSFDPDFYSNDWIVYDDNADGTIDYAILLDNRGNTIIEVIDSDKNGYVDDFYYYEDGVFVRHEIDQNEDRKIDIWVYLTKGAYVRGFELDQNFDGIIDKVKIFDESDEE